MYVFVAFGIIFFAFSIILFFRPSAINRLNELGQKDIILQARELKVLARIILGVFFLVATAFMVYFAFFKGITP